MAPLYTWRNPFPGGGFSESPAVSFLVWFWGSDSRGAGGVLGFTIGVGGGCRSPRDVPLSLVRVFGANLSPEEGEAAGGSRRVRRARSGAGKFWGQNIAIIFGTLMLTEAAAPPLGSA
ncbi:hypothetical protein chiPu_0026908 [Chiloscyllium punctatum]|uniref:Uncharacterized protein n=1 Tax=Chiloscyllium punctatum TaxID=137246 RepID=A0A401TK65_CHIPU|nr:hypothetical protein [Chiloscyllium punctatum]